MSQIILAETPTGVINLQPKITEEDLKKSIQSKTEKKLRRRISMPKNLFRLSRRNTVNNKINVSDNCVKDAASINDEQNSDKNRRIFRRASWRKFISRIAQLTVNIGAKHTENTDRVPPLGNYIWPSDQTPGVTGLRNHGNTCFMNAVIQCLSHTDILAEYFVLDQYKADLKRRNKLNSRKFGTKGELTEQLALVLKALWTCKDEPEHSTSFKAVVDRYGTQFRSSTQHDAQEFLFWLLDKVHEDLNQANKRKYKTIKNSYGRSDEVIAAETLANHIRCNNSFVQAVFQAQFRSSLACPRCHKQSNTFDPFHCISVQLPQLAQQAVLVTVVYATQHPKQVKLGLSVPSGSPIVALKEQLQSDTGIPLDRMILAEITETGFSRVLCDSYPISSICDDSGPVYLIESPKPNVDSTNIMLCLANVIRGEKMDVKRFGTPFCVQVSRDISFVDLQKLLLKEMSTILKSEIFSYSTPLNEMFKIRLQDPSADPDTYIESSLEHPLFTEIIDLALSVLPTDAGPQHVKLLLEWTEPEKFFSDMSDPFVEHESCSEMRDKIPGSSNLTLVECLEHYTKAETLSAEDAWRCPHCQKYLPVVKTLGLWSLPDILVVHFKRFRQQQLKGPQAAKLTTMVQFPINGFDMTPHLARAPEEEGNMNLEDGEEDEDNWSPWKKTRRRGSTQSKDNRYDLYAVCYHQGDTLETGHYTAACKNPYDHEWYKFDDQRINHVAADELPDAIVNNEAYILFYQRRKSDAAECSGTSSTSGDHWVSKIAPNIGTAPKASTENVTEEDIIVKNEVTETIQVETHIEEVPDTVPVLAEEIVPIVLKIEEEEVLEPVVIPEVPEIIPEIKSLVEPVKIVVPEKIKTPNKMQLWENSSSRVNFSDIVSNSLHDLDLSKRQSRLSTSSYRTKDCDTISMIRGSNSCSKDTLLYIDQQTQSLMDEDDVLIGNRSHWISPVTPHKLITVSPKN